MLEKLDKELSKDLHHNSWYFEPALTMLVAFVISFWITRYVRTGASSWIVADTAIHHFIWALGLLTIRLIIGKYFRGQKARYLLTWADGGLLGIIYDEFGMWLHLKEDDGRSMKGFWIVNVTLLIIFILRVTYRFCRATV